MTSGSQPDPRPDPRPDLGDRAGRWARKLAAIFTVGIYTINAPFGYVILAGLSFAWRRDPVGRARRLQRVSAFAYRLMHDWIRWFRLANFNHRGALPGLPQQPCVVIANHPTLLDITAITAVMGGGCTIAKPEMHGRRMLHPMMVGSGHIAGPGPDLLSVGRVVDEAVMRLGQGMSMIVFPEGTRSPPQGMLPFGRIAFEIACRAQVPLVSVGVRCEPIYLSKEVGPLDPPGTTPRLELTLLAIDDPRDVGCDSRALLTRAEARFGAWFTQRRLARAADAPYIGNPEDTECPISSKTA